MWYEFLKTKYGSFDKKTLTDTQKELEGIEELVEAELELIEKQQKPIKSRGFNTSEVTKRLSLASVIIRKKMNKSLEILPPFTPER